ncbi:hypothetical protein F9662_03985 [Campylobacter jejuni]|nr:hypothetical protein [Campylobacter jejuni]
MIKTIKILAFLAIFAFALSIALCFYLFFDYFIEERNIIILTLIFICRRKNKISIWKNKTSIKVEILFFYKP